MQRVEESTMPLATIGVIEGAGHGIEQVRRGVAVRQLSELLRRSEGGVVGDGHESGGEQHCCGYCLCC